MWMPAPADSFFARHVTMIMVHENAAMPVHSKQQVRSAGHRHIDHDPPKHCTFLPKKISAEMCESGT